jgi:pullulanase/glycogen debranching enzyme
MQALFVSRGSFFFSLPSAFDFDRPNGADRDDQARYQTRRGEGQAYGYRVEGPFYPAREMRFDCNKVLLDPYGRGVVVPKNYSCRAAEGEGDSVGTAMKSAVVDSHR